MAAQALFLLTGDKRLLDFFRFERQTISLPYPATNTSESARRLIPAGSRTEATLVFMRQHASAFQTFTQYYLKIGPHPDLTALSWRQLTRNSLMIRSFDLCEYQGICEFLDIAQSDKKLHFHRTTELQRQVMFRPAQGLFFIADDLFHDDMSQELLHRLLQQWLIFQDEFWYCHFLSVKEMTMMLREHANHNMTLTLSPEWFPHYSRELQEYRNPTQFEFLQGHRNPFLLTIEDLQNFKSYWQIQLLDKQVRLTHDLLGLASAVLGIDCEDTEQLQQDTVPVPIPLRHLLHVAAGLNFSELSPAS